MLCLLLWWWRRLLLLLAGLAVLAVLIVRCCLCRCLSVLPSRGWPIRRTALLALLRRWRWLRPLSSLLSSRRSSGVPALSVRWVWLLPSILSAVLPTWSPRWRGL